MAQIDVVARLQLKAEQFSSETGRQFADLKTRAASTAQDIRSSFSSSFAEVQKLAGQALQMPRTGGGSLDLSSEIAGLKEAAKASDQRAIALRELSIAQSAAASNGRNEIESLRLEADASAAGSLAAEQHSAALRRRIGALEATQTELNRTASTTATSTAVLRERERAEADLARRSEELLRALDPTRAAHARYNEEVAGAKALLDAGVISADHYAQAQTRSAAALREVADAAGVARDRQAALWREQASNARAEVGVRDMIGTFERSSPVKSARSSAAVFEADAIERDAKARREAEFAFQQFENRVRSGAEAMRIAEQQERELAAGAAELRAMIDPAAAVMANLNMQLANAKRALDAGKLSTEEYTEAERMLRANAEQTVQGMKGGTMAAGQQRQAYQQLGFQLNDVATQWSSGTKISMIFAQQSGQVIQALQMMSTKTSGLLYWLGSPWGAVFSAAAIVAIPLVAKLWEQGDATKEAIDKLKKDAVETGVADKAKAAFGRTLEGVTAAIQDQRAALDEAAASERSAAERANVLAKANRDKALAIREATAAKLEEALAEERSARQAALDQQRYGKGEGATQAYAFAQGRVASLKGELKKADAAVVEARKNLEGTRVDLAKEAAERAADPIKRINKLYDDQVAAIQRSARAEARKGEAIDAALTRQIKKINERREADLKAERDRQATANRRPPALGEQLRTEQGTSVLAAAQRYAGASERTSGGRATLRELFSSGGIAIDPEKTAWCAAFVNAVLAGQGIRGTGSLGARSFLGYGTATNRPTQGDIVVLKRGKDPAQGHVGFYAGEKNGRILVTGGNQGDKVSTDSFQRSDVLGFRRAPSASKSYADELRDQKKAASEAAAEQKRLEAELDQVLKALDPMAAALGRYNDRLADLARLEVAGKISLEQRADLTREARGELTGAQGKAANDNFRQIFGAEQVDAVLADWDRTVKNASDDFGSGVRAAARNFGDEIRYGLGGALDLLQVRLSGPLQRLLQPGGIAGQAKESADSIVKGLRNAGVKLDDASADKLARTVGSVLTNASYGQLGGSVFASITGGRENKTASAVGGVIGGELGKIAGPAIAKTIGGTLGKTLGGAAGPLGAIAGGILGNVVGNLFAKTKKGSSTIMFGDQGLYAGAAQGNSGSAKAAAAASANSVVGAINRVAEALGGEILGAGSVSIGKRKDQFVVDPTGRGRTKGAGTMSFGSEEEAIRAAIADALRDGVVGGISDASKQILAAGGDLEKAVTKAGLIEAVPRDLKAMLDPVGAAIDELNRKFKKTVDALKEGGASAEQMAQAQRLYDLQLEQVKASTASAAQGLKDFLLELKIGGSSPLSLRDQEAAALAELQPFLSKIDAGQTIDQAKYQAAAKAYLDVEKQLYGSTEQFFAAFERVQASTAKAIASAENVQPIAPAVESPFAKATADGVQVGNEIGAQQTELLQRIAITLEAMGGPGWVSDGAFVGTGRNFVQVA